MEQKPKQYITKKGWSPLFVAEYPEVIEIMLAHGAQIEVISNEGATVLHYYASRDCIDGIYLLLRNGCNIKAIDNRGLTADHYAAEDNHDEVLKKLLDQGLDPNSRNKANRGSRSQYDSLWIFSVSKYVTSRKC